jgi:hypothetical protein
MLPNEMVLAPLQKLKIKYELFYQSTTRLKYIDKFDQFLEDNFLTGRAISMTLCMKIIVTIVLVLRYLPFFHII